METTRIKIIHENENTVIYFPSQDLADIGKPVMVKALKNQFPNPQQILRFKNEYQLTKDLDCEGVRKVIKFEKYASKEALWLEYVDGKTLKHIIEKSGKYNLSFRHFLNIAVDLAQIISLVHQHGIIHKNINPNNILVNPHTLKVTLIDFSIASKVNYKSQGFNHPSILEGNLAYMSPEQTGRVNRYIDHRTDLYSLGITLYELFTSQLPFHSDDPMELVHLHIAKKPVPPHILNPKLPQALSNIILKLLAKNAEDRYQSAYGLKSDLVRCLLSYNETSTIENFSPGENDFSANFQIPQKLYGRDKETILLYNAFERISKGKTEAIFISGPSGVGKTGLAHEIHKPVTVKRGYFIEGKFDQQQRDTPYYAIVQAFKELINQLLTENDQKLETWKHKILKVLGKNGKIMTELIPSLELLIGPQPDPGTLRAAELQNLYTYLFRNFLKALATYEHPLVLFIDDLQWADSASLNLLKVILTDKTCENFLFIGSYRNSEINALHPLSITLKEISKAHTRTQTINLDNLDENAIQELVLDTLHSQALPIAKMVFDITKGNVFFAREFLKSLYQSNLLYFDYEQKTWQWKADKLHLMKFTDNIGDLMVSRINSLSSQAQDIIKLAACIGNRFDLNTLASISHHTFENTALLLHEAISEGLVLTIGHDIKILKVNHTDTLQTRFQFAHDKIQAAAYNLLSETEKVDIHLSIGRILLKETKSEKLEEDIFDITYHLNYGLPQVSDDDEKCQIARYNLKAGKKAKASAAYQPAYEYLKAGINLVGKKCWEKDYLLATQIFTEGAEAAYLSGDFDQMEKWLETILLHANNPLDRVKAYAVKVHANISRNKLMDAIAFGLEGLAQLNIHFPIKPHKGHILLALAQTRIALIGKSEEDILIQPEMTNEKALAAVPLLASVASAAYFVLPELMALVILKTVSLSLKYGNTIGTAYAYSGYGLILCSAFGDIENGYKYGRIALKLNDVYDIKGLRARPLFVVNTFISHWKEPLKNTLNPIQKGYLLGLESGDFEFSAHCINVYCEHGFFAGKHLESLDQEMRVFGDSIASLRQQKFFFFQAYHQMVQNLLGFTTDPILLKGKIYNEDELLKEHIHDKNNIALFNFYLCKSILCYFFNKPTRASEFIDLAKPYLQYMAGLQTFGAYHFYCALIKLSAYHLEPRLTQHSILQTVNGYIHKLKKWAKKAPINFQHRLYLVQAELLRVKKKHKEAREMYDKAIALARVNGFIKEEALAWELASQFYLNTRKEILAGIYIENAYHIYEKWGAKAKTKQIEKRFSKILKWHAKAKPALNSLHDHQRGKISLDMHSLIKASQILAGEIVLSKLLEKMIHLVVENGGAEIGYLILHRDGQWKIDAQSRIDNGKISVLQGLSIEDEEQETQKMLCVEIVNYVIRSKRTVVLHNASEEGLFMHTSYIQRTEAKSVICLPLLNQGRLSGILYMENNLSAGIFNAEKLEVLNMLSIQLAISLENALLYGTLEEKVKERTDALTQAYDEINKKNRDITASITYARRIQNAMLPNPETIKSYLPDSFIFFKPRDIVSGDLYWFSAKNNKIFLAAVDCTGHGVPGAFMSLVANDLLNEIINQRNISEAHNILAVLDKGVKHSLKQNENQNNDGMDMALCVINNVDNHTKTPNAKYILDFAGAKNPLVYIQDNKVFEIHGDKTSIGGNLDQHDPRFTKHSIVIAQPTCVYMFSDGFQDQFGGPNNKKFMKKRLYNLLLQIHHKPMNEQRLILFDEINQWMKDEEQVDDMLIIGFRL
jgi:histidine kinase